MGKWNRGRASRPAADVDVRWVVDDRYRLAFDVAPVGLLLLDLEGGCLEMNPHLRRLLGLGDAPPRPLASFAEPEDRRRLLELLGDLRSGAIAGFEIELRVTTADGQRRVLHDVVSRVREDDPCLVCVVTDVTEQKARQAALHRRSLQLAEGEAIAAMGSYDLDPADGSLAWTDGVYRLLGHAPRSFVPTIAIMRDHVVPDDLPAFDAEVARLRAGAREVGMDLRVRRSDGEVREWRVEGRVRTLEDGTTRVVGVVQDVTDQREAERIKDEVVAVVSHELRTPLTMILAPLTMLDQGMIDARSDAGREFIRRALESTRHMTRLVADIFDLGRLRTGHLTVHARTFDLATCLRDDVAARRAAEARRPGGPRVAFEVAAPDGLQAWADPDRVQQVLTNLIDNAIAFSPPGGQVRVSAAARGAEVQVAVSDQGPGVPAAHRETVFERFRQLDPASTRARGGSGLGLTICKHLVERQGGRIWIEEAEGGGARVVFTLPARAL